MGAARRIVEREQGMSYGEEELCTSSALAQTTQKVFVQCWVTALLGKRAHQDHTEIYLCSDN